MAAIDATDADDRGPAGSIPPGPPSSPATGGPARDGPGLLDVLDQRQPGAEARFDALRELGQRASDGAGTFQGGIDALSSWHAFDMVRRRNLLDLQRDTRVERQEAAFGWIRVAGAAVSLLASIVLVALVIGGQTDPLRAGSLAAVALGGVAPALVWRWRSEVSRSEAEGPASASSLTTAGSRGASAP